MALSKHVTHYGPRPGFPYYNMAAPPTRGPPLSATWGSRWASSVGRALETAPVPSFLILIIIGLVLVLNMHEIFATGR